MGLLSRLRRSKSAPSRAPDRLRPAPEAIERWRAHGADRAAALREVQCQLAGLRREVDDDARWSHLVRMARQAGDPWNADDWPLGFDALVCAIPLCTHVSFECARCPVGLRQQGRSCAHPQSAFGHLGHLVRVGDREAIRQHLAQLSSMLGESSGGPR